MRPDARESENSARSRAYAQARRHSRRVRFFKVAIPLGATLGVAAIVGITFLDPFGRMKGLSLGPMSLSGTQITMERPRLAGHRKEGQPYEVTATVAIQDVRKPNVLELKDMRARFATDDSGRTTRLFADVGVFDTAKEQLELRQNVLVTTDDGQEARLASASIDFKAGTVISRERVSVTLPNGLVEADGLEVIDGGKAVSFIGRVSTVLQSPEPRPAAPVLAASPDLGPGPAGPPAAHARPAKTSRAEPTSLRP